MRASRRVGSFGRVSTAIGVMALGVLGACIDQSPVDPDAVVQVHGAVHDPTGAPLGSRPVRMGTGVTAADGALGVLTVGLSCTGGGCQGEVWDTTTRADGGFAFEVTGRDTQSSFGEARSTLVSVSAAPADGAVSGASASARFEIRTERVDLPLLALVDPGLEVDGGTTVRATWRAAAPGPHELRFEQAELVPVWSVTVDGLEASIDPRVLEGTSGRVVVAGRGDDEIEGSDVVLQWRSPGVGYASSVGPPASRGRACAAVAADGTVGPAVDDCGLTDGDLTSSTLLPSVCPDGATCAEPIAMQVDLGAPMPVELIVVRGCAGGCAVEVSGDGTSWAPAGAAAEDYGMVALDGAPVSAVRVGVGSEPISGLREVSVWGPIDPGADLDVALPSADAGGLRDAFGVETPDDGRPWWLVFAAGASVATTLVVLGVVIGRRR